MVKQVFDIQDYWQVIVFYDVDYDSFGYVVQALLYAGISEEQLDELYYMLKSGKAKAVTYSNQDRHISVVLINQHKTKKDYINSLIHEAEHVKQAILQVYQVEDFGEAPAYTIGYIVSEMYHVFDEMICECYRNYTSFSS